MGVGYVGYWLYIQVNSNMKQNASSANEFYDLNLN